MTTLSVKFIFANHDGITVTLNTTTDTKVIDLKQQLIKNWPSEIQKCEEVTRIRFICMGSGMLKDNLSLGPKFPIFPDHPTPINVSIRPEGTGNKSEATNPLQQKVINDTSESLIQQSSNQNNRRCCCIIS